MPDGGWYQVAEGPELLQGDILHHCPVFLVAGTFAWPPPPDAELPIRVEEISAVVMTQSCDLANDKVKDVLLAELVAWPEIVKVEAEQGNAYIRSKQFRKKLIEGSAPGLSLFAKHDAEPRLHWSVVEFHRLYSLPKAFLQQFAAAAGLRLRLRSPYREHLAQAFARYFMRVGLPHDARDFEKEGDVIG